MVNLVLKLTMRTSHARRPLHTQCELSRTNQGLLVAEMRFAAARAVTYAAAGAAAASSPPPPPPKFPHWTKESRANGAEQKWRNGPADRSLRRTTPVDKRAATPGSRRSPTGHFRPHVT